MTEQTKTYFRITEFRLNNRTGKAHTEEGNIKYLYTCDRTFNI